MLWHLLLHVIGLDGSGYWYNFWSGFGSDLGEAALIGGLISMYRKHNCHVKGCWRLTWRPVAGTTFTVCRRHHPENAPTEAQVHAAHRAAKKEGS